MQDEIELRLECVRTAMIACNGDPVSLAAEIYEFAIGKGRHFEREPSTPAIATGARAGI